MRRGRSRRNEIWVHALGAKVGGGLTYLAAVVPELARQAAQSNLRIVVLASGRWQGTVPRGVEVREYPWWTASASRRLVFDQIVLPMLLVRARPKAVFFSGTFSTIVHRCKTVVLLRNTIYFDPDFISRRPLGVRVKLALQRALAIAGASRSSVVLYPSFTIRGMVETVAPWLKPKGRVNPFGFREDMLELREEAHRRKKDGALTFLLVANYTFQKNITTVLRALSHAQDERLPIRLLLTSSLKHGPVGAVELDQSLVAEHGLIEAGYLVLLGPRHGDELRALYRDADACLMPSITESFGHPMLEAMAAGRPLLCADRPYAREMCGSHARYFDPDDPTSLLGVWRGWSESASPPPPSTVWMQRRFSWPQHCAGLLTVLDNGAPQV